MTEGESGKEKLVIEIDVDMLAEIEILLQEGVYSSFSVFVDRAFADQLRNHRKVIDNYDKRTIFSVGVTKYSAKMLESRLTSGKKLDLRIIGGLVFDDDVTPELFDRAVNSIKMAGILRGPDDVMKLARPMRQTLLGKSYKNQFLLDEKED